MLKAGFNHKNREENGLNWYFNYSDKSLKEIMANDKKLRNRFRHLFQTKKYWHLFDED